MCERGQQHSDDCVCFEDSGVVTGGEESFKVGVVKTKTRLKKGSSDQRLLCRQPDSEFRGDELMILKEIEQ